MIELNDWNDSPQYIKMQEDIITLLKRRKKALTLTQIKKALGTDKFLGDALQILTFAGAVAINGSVLLPKYRFATVKDNRPTRKICANCQTEQPIKEFYQEWSGRPSARCKRCKIFNAKKRGPKPKKSLKGKKSSTREPRQR